MAVHPDDPRYKELVGRYLRLPIMDRRIPIIADDYVEPEFGSGCVKITPAHDFNDYAIGPVVVNGIFFVGASVDHAAGDFPASVDQSSPSAMSSWVASGTVAS